MPRAASAPARKSPRAADAELSRANILEVARREFADKGLSGARIDEIAEKTNTSKRMIYYHFGSKEGLYQAVLEEAYGGIRETETSMPMDSISAEEALADQYPPDLRLSPAASRVRPVGDEREYPPRRVHRQRCRN